MNKPKSENVAASTAPGVKPVSLDFDENDTPLNLKYYEGASDMMPHVIQFSGGRSSGYMLAQLLHNGQLDAGRGDVVLFQNTSAEHPATYRFVLRMKRFTESFGIPFFMLETCTYERKYKNGRLGRSETVRMVKPVPADMDNPNGFHTSGEVFEEFMALRGRTPSRSFRTCTHHMKIEAGNKFLSHWLKGGEVLPRMGDSHIPEMTDEMVIATHKRHKGNRPDDVLLAQRAFARGRPACRPEQLFQDYTDVDLSVREIDNDSDIYVGLIGFRFDEGRRVRTLISRTCGGQERAPVPKNAELEFIDLDYQDSKPAKPKSARTSRPKNERALAPLYDSVRNKDMVNVFWKRQPWGLELSETAIAGNCTFCFLKTRRKLITLAQMFDGAGDSNELRDTPMDIDWWIRVEELYALDRRKQIIKTTDKSLDVDRPIGFFDVKTKTTYRQIKAEAAELTRQGKMLPDETTHDELPCNCTD